MDQRSTSTVSIDTATPDNKGLGCYSRQCSDDKVLLSLRVPNRLLLSWSNTVQIASPPSSYITLLNSAIVSHAVDSTRIKERLHNAARRLKMELRHCSGNRRRQSFLDGNHHLFILEGETEDIEDSILEPPCTSRESCTSTDDNPVSSQGKHRTLVVDSNKYQVDFFFLGGDYKVRTTTTTKNNSKYINCVQLFLQFLLLILGLNQATSIYGCVWCNIHKDERYYHIHIIL